MRSRYTLAVDELVEALGRRKNGESDLSIATDMKVSLSRLHTDLSRFTRQLRIEGDKDFLNKPADDAITALFRIEEKVDAILKKLE